MVTSVFDRGENIVGKGEIACFQKASFPDPSKGVIVWEWAKGSIYLLPDEMLSCKLDLSGGKILALY